MTNLFIEIRLSAESYPVSNHICLRTSELQPFPDANIVYYSF